MKKEIKERFSSLVWKRETKNGCTNRELYLARAFLLGVPYCVLERKAETLPSTYSIAYWCALLLQVVKDNSYNYLGAAQDLAKAIGVSNFQYPEKFYFGEIENWIWQDFFDGKVQFGEGVSVFSRKIGSGWYQDYLKSPTSYLSDYVNGVSHEQIANCA